MPKSEDDNVRAIEPMLPSQFRCRARQRQYLSTGFYNTTPASTFLAKSKHRFTIPEDRVVIDRSKPEDIGLGGARPGKEKHSCEPGLSLARAKTMAVPWRDVEAIHRTGSHSLQLAD